MARRGAPPEVSAGSMADIAFLLLIFFLVTTTIETSEGLDRMLPPKEPPTDTPPVVKQKNIFTVTINKEGQLLVEEEELEQMVEKEISKNSKNKTLSHLIFKKKKEVTEIYKKVVDHHPEYTLLIKNFNDKMSMIINR